MLKKSKHKLKVSFGKKASNKIDYDPEVKTSFLFQGDGTHVLAVAWDIDDTEHGFWRITVIGFDEKGKMLTKQIQKDKTSIAFFGDISIVGAGRNDLYTSDGYEDADVIDEEGNIVNKATEINIYPSRK